MWSFCTRDVKIKLQPPTIKLASLFWRLLEALQIDLQTKVGWVLKTSGNSPFVGHWNFSIWTKESKDNCAKRELGSKLLIFWRQLGWSLRTSNTIIFCDNHKVTVHIWKLMTRWFQSTPNIWILLKFEGAMAFQDKAWFFVGISSKNVPLGLI